MSTSTREAANIIVSHKAARLYLAATAPALYILYSAGWAAGFTTNGIRPRD